MVNCCTLFSIRQSVRSSNALWTNGLFGVPKKIFRNHLRTSLHDTPETGQSKYSSLRALMKLNECHSYVSLYAFYSTQPHFLLTFQMNLPRKIFRGCTAQTCTIVPPQSHCKLTDSYILFLTILNSFISTWFLGPSTQSPFKLCRSNFYGFVCWHIHCVIWFSMFYPKSRRKKKKLFELFVDTLRDYGLVETLKV